MFCPECGTQIGDEEVIFCPECGTRILDVSASTTPTSEHAYACDVRGVLLTNVCLLAKKLHVSQSDLLELLNAFIARKRESGVDYVLVDAHHYTCYKKYALGIPKVISLKGNESPLEYVRILTDLYEGASNNGGGAPDYLFIIGSHDVIPMLTVPHYKASVSFSDKDIDTDIIYSYLYSEDLIAKLISEELFAEPQRFKVGRLPVGEDTTFEALTGYLERDIVHSQGITMESAYAQCDPHWKMVSESVATDGYLKEWMRNLDGKIPSQFYHGRLMLTPYIDSQNIEQVFPKDATFYYYNLHGSDGLEETGYLGEYPPHKRQYVSGVYPYHMTLCNRPNIVATESCYGARHIGLDASHSMLLSAIYSNTMLFLGSSRIAWGSIDSNQVMQSVSISYADTIVNAFMKLMLQGYDAGVALPLARKHAFQSNSATPERAATIIEFNLFGDPTLFLHIPGAAKAQQSNNALTMSNGRVGKTYVVENLGAGETQQPQSILEQVRREVDASLAEIHNMVTQHLYKYYGLPQRPATGVYRITASDGSKRLQFDFTDSPSNSHFAQYSAICTTDGAVLSVITTK